MKLNFKKIKSENEFNSNINDYYTTNFINDKKVNHTENLFPFKDNEIIYNKLEKKLDNVLMMIENLKVKSIT